MITITEKMVKKVLPESRAIEVVEKALRDYSDQTITMGSRGFLEISKNGDACIFLPAFHKSDNFFSMKYAASFPKCAEKRLPTVQSVIWLFSSETGEPCAMIQANALTAIKTGAASAVATRYLSKQDANILTIIGAGEQAKTQLSCISLVRDLKEIRLTDLDHNRCTILKTWIENSLDSKASVQIASSSDEAVTDADLIVTCTTSNRPVLDGKYIKESVHINAIGSFTPEMQEIDEYTIQRADKIITDSIPEAWKCAGDLIVPMEKGLISKNLQITELGDIINNKADGRKTDQEITLYESVGFSPLDLAIAIEVYQQILLSTKTDH